MMQLKELVTTDRRFQKSINLRLDMGDIKRLENYIPTRSSVSILKKYLKDTQYPHGENATILLGPYGKGKSHLLLVLLAVLEGKKKELSAIAKKIEDVDGEAGKLLRDIWNQKKKFLPVLVSPSGTDLNGAFLYALREALERAQLSNITPASNYAEAVKVIGNWKKNYVGVYKQLELLLRERQTTVKELQNGLREMKKCALELFESCYPMLTAGSIFQPMIQMEALKVYQDVNRELTENHEYTGMVLVFDEFSKYIEGHGMKHFANDMKTLQDMCELANNDQEHRLSVILVAHKSIHEYEKGIHKNVQNLFKGVEGRLSEIPFVVTAQNNYELIADTLIKKDPVFSQEFERLKQTEVFCTTAEISYKLPCFHKLFPDYESYEEMIVKGCFPMTPVCAYALLHISEKIAQNERTIFTFLANQEPKSLPGILKQGKEELIGIDAIYDYFRILFRESTDLPSIHNEWLKADYALRKGLPDVQKRIVKAIALIRMIHREEELPAQDEPIYAALGMDRAEYQEAMKELREKDIIIYRSSQGIYTFKNNVGVDVEKEIQKEVVKQPKAFPICSYLNRISKLQYVLPKQYNQIWNMTRYFQYEFMTVEQFLQIDISTYLFEEQFSDGKIIALVSKTKIEKEIIQRKIEALGDERVVVLIPEETFQQEESLRCLSAVNSLQEQPDFIENNQVLEQELALYEEDIVFEINTFLERDYLPGNGRCLVLYQNDKCKRFRNEMEFNRCLSEILEDYYRFSPRVNHELLNIQQVSGQYLRARTKVVAAILEEQGECYEAGTAPECMVYRAAFVRTGILGNQFPKDCGCSRIMTELERFFQTCAGRRKSFAELYQHLQGKDFGVRRGILPLFVAQKLTVTEGTAVIYLGKRELELNAETINSVNNFPQDYEVYLEVDGAKKEQYLRSLEEIWGIDKTIVFKKQNRWKRILDAMQKWYRSLPQYTMTTKSLESPDIPFRNLLRRAELNAREVLFERIPDILQETDFVLVTDRLKQIKKEMEQCFLKLQETAADIIREVFHAQKQENIKACLTLWYQQQGEDKKDYILNTSAMNFLVFLENIPTNNDQEIAAQMSKQILDIYMEDWKDETLEIFRRELQDIKNNLEEKPGSQEKTGSGKTFILKDSSGKSIKKNYDVDIEEDTTSIYLMNMIDEAMEEFADTLETNQKVAVLIEVLEKLLQ